MGINNIPAKVCTYSCVYCQLGRTLRMDVVRTPFYEPREIFQQTKDKVEKTREKGLKIDYLTFVPDGEPTLDVKLGQQIEMLKPLGIKIAVITNGSLISLEDVREELAKADWVSLKVDCARPEVWRRINRPQRKLKLSVILDGMLEFARFFKGDLVTETMLVRGVNNKSDHLHELAEVLTELQPTKAYLSVPSRPPAEKWVHPPGPEDINVAFQVFRGKLDQVEYLIGYEGDAFAFTGNVEEDLLSITSVHPMRESAVSEFLAKARKDWTFVNKLMSKRKLVETVYNGQKFYLRNIECYRRK